MVTPLLGTAYQIRDQNEDEYNDYITELNISYFYLFWEYNILKKGWSYMNNRKLGGEYIEAYVYWVNRQFNIMEPIFEKLGCEIYFPDFNVYLDNMYREISQDILYVMLNILLAKSKLENSNLNFNLVNLSVLEKIISDHYNTYDKSYKCIYKLREFKSKYDYSVNS